MSRTCRLPLVRGMMRKAIAYLKAGLPRKPRYQPFRNTYGIAVWLATPIKPRWGFVAPQTWASLCRLRLRRGFAPFRKSSALFRSEAFRRGIAPLRSAESAFRKNLSNFKH